MEWGRVKLNMVLGELDFISVIHDFQYIKTYENIYVDAWLAHCKGLSAVAMSNLNSHDPTPTTQSPETLFSLTKKKKKKKN